jgi:oligopeptide transport system permease protein
MSNIVEATSETQSELAAGADAQPLRARAWQALKSNPLFWISAVLITIFVLMAAFPWLFTTQDPRAATLAESGSSPSPEHWFGQDRQGYDLYTRCVYGARASIMVGVLTTTMTATVGTVFGLFAGYLGGWIDAVISRFAEIFFGIPLILGAIIIMTSLNFGNTYLGTVLQVVFVLTVLGWPSIFRLMRSAVLQVKPNDYVQAARALGASPLRIIGRHIMPNALSPVIVVSTINLGVFIAAEASLSFLGIGLQPPTVSWGVMISSGGIGTLRSAPHVMLFPALFLSLAVLAFIMLGDAIRDAFDPKAH